MPNRVVIEDDAVVDMPTETDLGAGVRALDNAFLLADHVIVGDHLVAT